jgi:predicted Fe-Mo cluster-binding NifX family protein
MADTESGHIDMVRNTGHHHEHGHCKPITHMDVGRTDAVVCRGMGRRAFALLRDGGLDVWITSADTVRDALADAREGRLRRLSLDSACSGHGAGHAHGA